MKYFGDAYMELEELYNKLSVPCLEELIFNKVHYMSMKEWSYFKMDKKKALEAGLGDMMLARLLRDEKYGEMLEKRILKLHKIPEEIKTNNESIYG